MIKTAVETGGPKVTVTPAPNDRALVQLEGRMFTLIDEVLTHEEIVSLLSGLTRYVLNNSTATSEWAA